MLIALLGFLAIVLGVVAKVIRVHEVAELLLKAGFALILFDVVVEVANHYSLGKSTRSTNRRNI